MSGVKVGGSPHLPVVVEQSRTCCKKLILQHILSHVAVKFHRVNKIVILGLNLDKLCYWNISGFKSLGSAIKIATIKMHEKKCTNFNFYRKQYNVQNVNEIMQRYNT